MFPTSFPLTPKPTLYLSCQFVQIMQTADPTQSQHTLFWPAAAGHAYQIVSLRTAGFRHWHSLLCTLHWRCLKSREHCRLLSTLRKTLCWCTQSFHWIGMINHTINTLILMRRLHATNQLRKKVRNFHVLLREWTSNFKGLKKWSFLCLNIHSPIQPPT